MRTNTESRRFGLRWVALVIVAVGAVIVLAVSLDQIWTGPSVPVGSGRPVGSSSLGPSPSRVTPTVTLSQIRGFGTFGVSGIWVLGGDQVVASDDMGRTWTLIKLDGPGTPAVGQVWSVKRLVLVALDPWPADSSVETTVTVSQTEDGGASWRNTVLGQETGLRPFVAADNSGHVGLLLGRQRHVVAPSQVFSSLDWGRSWSAASLVQDPSLVGPIEVAGLTMLAVAADAREVPPQASLLAQSTDEGRTWSLVALPVPAGFRLQDRGELSEPAVTPAGHWRVAVPYANDAQAALVIVDETATGWQPTGFLDVPVPDPASVSVGGGVVAVASGGRLNLSADGGRSWSQRDVPGPGQPDGIRFASPVNGSILMRDPDGAVRLFATDDGGSTWRLVVRGLR